MPDSAPGPRPLTGVPMASHGHRVEPGHLTVLPEEDERLRAELAALLADQGGPPRPRALAALSNLCGRSPAFLDAWARLAQAAYLGGDEVAAYAYARVGYHRGLDRLRRHGWGGTGQVRWQDTSNRGFLRSVQMLMVAAAALGEMEEADRCRQFLLDLDPEDGMGMAGRPPLAPRERVGAEALS
ncbi:MAG: DUF3151 domain-containing protein [Candidatus Dormibacteria bacterium]